MAGSFANHAAIAIELAEARAEQQRAAMLDERDRIAADLHDQVIQRLFAAGLSLRSAAMGLGPGRTADRILATVAELDATTRQIRTTIFELHDHPASAPAGLRARLIDVAADAAKALASIRPSGSTDRSTRCRPRSPRTSSRCCARPWPTSPATRARSASVGLAVRSDLLSLCVNDDGIGITPTPRTSGLAHTRRRAERHGECHVTRRHPSGTTVLWTIPRS